jgi:hypothetical protein
VTDYVLKAFEALRPDLDGLYTSAHAKPLAEWKRTQQALVTASGAGAAAVPGLHLVGMAADVMFLMNRMSVCSYGIGAILATEANLGNVLEPEDFPVVLAVWAGEGGVAETISGQGTGVAGGKVLGKSVYRILAKTVCEKAGLMVEGKMSRTLAGKVAARFAGKLGGKAATGFIPLFGAVVGGGVNLWFLSGIASAAEQWFRYKVKA